MKKRAAPAAPAVNTVPCAPRDHHSPCCQRSVKKRKVTSSKRDHAKSDRHKPKGKENAFEREYIAIPGSGPDREDDKDDLSEHDEALLDDFGDSINFLAELDHKGIARYVFTSEPYLTLITIHLCRSKKETERLFQLHKPVRRPRVDDLPSVDSHDEDAESWNTDIGDTDVETQPDDVTSVDSEGLSPSPSEPDSDTEMPYERVPRLHKKPELATRRNIPGLPIKLSDGRIQASEKVTLVPAEADDDEDTEGSPRSKSPPAVPSTVEDIATGARFGRLAVADVIGNSSRKARIQGAKDQIASICQEIIADPENSVRFLQSMFSVFASHPIS